MNTGMFWLMLGTEESLSEEIRIAVMHYFNTYSQFPTHIELNENDNPDEISEITWEKWNGSPTVKLSHSQYILPGHLLVGINET